MKSGRSTAVESPSEGRGGAGAAAIALTVALPVTLPSSAFAAGPTRPASTADVGTLERRCAIRAYRRRRLRMRNGSVGRCRCCRITTTSGWTGGRVHLRQGDTRLADDAYRDSRWCRRPKVRLCVRVSRRLRRVQVSQRQGDREDLRALMPGHWVDDRRRSLPAPQGAQVFCAHAPRVRPGRR